jgi:hypothetical protein
MTVHTWRGPTSETPLVGKDLVPCPARITGQRIGIRPGTGQVVSTCPSRSLPKAIDIVFAGEGIVLQGLHQGLKHAGHQPATDVASGSGRQDGAGGVGTKPAYLRTQRGRL